MIGLIENTGSAPKKLGYLVELIEAIFKQGGFLETALHLDHRPQQAAMALHVAQALETNSPLLVEAGTGVGKSLAYLIPGLIHSINSERPLVVSSHTITLQEQIRSKDLKLCRDLFHAVPELKRYAVFRTALMLGKANYCCTTRLSNALRDAQTTKQTELIESDSKTDLMRLAKWAASSKDGIFQELSPSPLSDVWELVNADSSTCSKKNCDPGLCFYQRARKQLLRSNCIIVNHSLLFSLINAGMPPTGDARGILLPDDFVVIDEGHRIPAIATDHFGIHVSSYALERALKNIYNPRTRRGLLRKQGTPFDSLAIKTALSATTEFFNYLGEAFLAQRSILRIHEAGFCENTLSHPLKEVADHLGAIIQKTKQEHIQDELRDARRRILSYRDVINAFVDLTEESHVYWLERGGKRGQLVTLRSAPLDVAPYLREALFSRHTAAILTSATLSDGTSIDPFQEKVGAEAAEAHIEYSPFNYKDNCRIYIASDAPSPDPGKGRLDLDYLADTICWLCNRVEGGSLVLFTSHFDLRQVHQRCEDFFAKHNRPLFCQGQGTERSELTHQLSEAGNGVLFGTDSFWTGIDVPGPSLSQVIMTRLPFDNPSHPVSEARSEHIRENGGNPFFEITLQDALIKFRQGMGRLIRRHEDSGNIILLDSRILAKGYGKHFINALPVQDFKRFSRDTRDQIFQ
ncbi:MAG: ATP-dependent DNA helicase DinG [Lentimonas sp.]|jgi:ATP-dependent DNA helicase DinG